MSRTARLALASLLAASCAAKPAPSVPARIEEACPEPAPPPHAPPRRPAATMSYLGADWLTRPERVREEDPDRLIEALHLRPGMVVADIGAGVGYHVWRIAPRVKPGGRVLATDLQPEMLAALDRNMKERGIDNVVPVQSSQETTGLPTAGVDLALLVDVYHELADPQRFLSDLRRSLRPAGRIALVEFRAEDSKVPIRPEHRMTAAQVDAELAEARFCPVERYEELPWQHLLVFSAAGRCGCAQPDRPASR